MKNKVLLFSLLLLAFILAGAGLGPAQASGDPNGQPTPDEAGYKTLPVSPRDLHRAAPFFSGQAAPQATGGPDHFGYTWDDTSPLAWIEASSGQVVTFTSYDDGTSSLSPDGSTRDPMPIGFPFKFYENAYTSVYVNTNGLLTFGQYSERPFGATLPHDSPPNDLIAPFWDDLVVGGSFNSGKVYFVTAGTAPNRYFVAQYQNVTRLGSSALLAFQVVLYESGDIWIQYKTLGGVVNRATVGIEDAQGLDGLLYLRNSAGLASGKAVRIHRPAASPRVKFLAHYQSDFILRGRAVIPVRIRNTGESGVDRFNLTPKFASQAASTGWEVSFFQSDRTTPLADTNGDSVVDTGPVAQGAEVEVAVMIAPPEGAEVGSGLQFTLQAASSLDPAKKDSLSLQAAIPAPFAQAFVDDRLGMELTQVWKGAASTTMVDNWFSGSTFAVVGMQNGGYLYIWEKSDLGASGRSYVNLEYAVLSARGVLDRLRVKLTDNAAPASPNLQVIDNYPSLDTAPSGPIGIAWVRSSRNFEDPLDPLNNGNVHLAILNAVGDVTVKDVNVTHNEAWTASGDNSVVTFSSPHIKATQDQRFIVSWIEERQQGEATVRDIWFAIYNQAGQVIKAPAQLTQSAATSRLYGDPDMERLNGGALLLAYSVEDPQAHTSQIAFQILDSNGVTQPGGSALAGASGFGPAAVQLSSGRILLAWTDLAQGSISFSVLDGTSFAPLSGPVHLPNPTTHPGGAVSIVTDEEGRAILNWMDTSWNSYLYYALLDENGTLLTPPLYFYSSQRTGAFILANETGQSNAPYFPNLGSRLYMPITYH